MESAIATPLVWRSPPSEQAYRDGIIDRDPARTTG